ncbi:alpha/beta hydrolase [Aeromicrobium terrae]|uniref:Alpha/beta hydrolase n=1 Tax=Aeromicrobium terrae TaxID=2498846 RepID=A0A5C8NJ50_9ACTN|nr:alpha/beta fold hydrolase [Aeromicrobium terrae]TXL60811.1 alpha/beta hydrolase [Aeromicrobium terrae]
MSVRARLIPTRVPKDPEAVVVVLHGGGSRRGNMMVSPVQLSVLRMIPIARKIARAGRRRVAVYRLLNSTRGWNTDHTPVDDAHWAIEHLREKHGDLPTALVGHSLGGRAALLAGHHESVTSVVALNPYLYPQDGNADLRGRDVLMVHGTADRVAPLRNAEIVADALSRTTNLSFVRVADGKHAMLSRHRVFSDLATDFVIATVLGSAPSGVLAADDWQTV